MAEQKIFRITEAFSMQPKCWYVGENYFFPGGERIISSIERGVIYDTGDPFDAYIGYGENAEKVFEIRVACATVEYF